MPRTSGKATKLTVLPWKHGLGLWRLFSYCKHLFVALSVFGASQPPDCRASLLCPAPRGPSPWPWADYLTVPPQGILLWKSLHCTANSIQLLPRLKGLLGSQICFRHLSSPFWTEHFWCSEHQSPKSSIILNWRINDVTEVGYLKAVLLLLCNLSSVTDSVMG